MSDETKDPAGLDSLLMATGQGIARWLEGATQAKTGIPVTIWDGKDGLGAILREHLDAAGVPNKRLPELVTPRSVLTAVNNAATGAPEFRMGLKLPLKRRRKRRAA